MIFLAIILSYAGWAVAGNLTVVHEWKYLDYSWNSVEERQAAIGSGMYIPENVFSIDVDVFEDQVWVTTPRYTEGVPASLSTVSNQTGDGGPLLDPYPDWSWHTRTDCKGITNTWSVVIDECNRLWVLDSGVLGTERVCPASLILFDAETNELLNRFAIPDEALHNPTANSSLVTPAVETHGPECKDTWVYMADKTGLGLLVWHNNVTWRLNSDVYGPSPDAIKFTTAGESFEWNDGVLGLVLSPVSEKLPRRKLFFSPISSYNQFSVNVSDLHNSWIRDISYEKSDDKLPSQITARAFSYRGVLFFGLASEMSLVCWNMERPFNADNLVTVAQDDDTLQFPSGIKVKRLPVRNIHSEYVWVTSNRFQKSMRGTRNSSEINFRIFNAPVVDLIAGTKCHS